MVYVAALGSLWGPGGEYTWLPLAHVTPEVAEWADHAVVRSEIEDHGKLAAHDGQPLGKVVGHALQQEIMARGVSGGSLAAAAQQIPVKDGVVRRHC